MHRGLQIDNNADTLRSVQQTSHYLRSCTFEARSLMQALSRRASATRRALLAYTGRCWRCWLLRRALRRRLCTHAVSTPTWPLPWQTGTACTASLPWSRGCDGLQNVQNVEHLILLPKDTYHKPLEPCMTPEMMMTCMQVFAMLRAGTVASGKVVWCTNGVILICVGVHLSTWCTQEHVVLPDGAAAGASSFGMSGVNAHAILRAPAVPRAQRPPGAMWRRERHWPAAQAHPLLLTAGFARNSSACR